MEYRELISRYFKGEAARGELQSAGARLIRAGEEPAAQALEREDLRAAAGEWILCLADALSPRECYARIEYPWQGRWRREYLQFIRVRSGWKLVLAVRATAPRRYANLFEPVHSQADAVGEITEAVLRYCDGVYHLDAEAALEQFTPDARMIHDQGEDMADVPCEVFRARWRGLPQPEELGLGQFACVYHVDLLSADAAMVKAGVAKLRDYYHDYLVCIRTGGRWRIAAKMTQLLWHGAETEGRCAHN